MSGDMNVALVLALWAFAIPAGTHATTSERTGYAYALDKDMLLYTEKHHESVENGRVVRSVVTYRDPEGQIVATKRLDFSGNAASPGFRLENARNGHLEGAEQRDDKLLVFFRRTTNHDYEEAKLDFPGRAIIDGGFDRFVESNWTRLLQGEVFKRPFLVPSLQRFLDFRIYLERRTDADVVFIMEPASLLLRIVGEEIIVTYDRDNAALKRYEGISNLRDQEGSNYRVRVEFPAAGGSRDTAGAASADRR